MTLHYLGEFASAREHLGQGIVFYDPQQYRSQAFSAGLDPGVVCLMYLAWVLWFLGYPDRALKMSQEALTQAQALAHPYTLAAILSYAAMLHQFRRECLLTQERAEAVITLSTEQGFRQWVMIGAGTRGWSLAEQEHGEEGIAQIHQRLFHLAGRGGRADTAVFPYLAG